MRAGPVKPLGYDEKHNKNQCLTSERRSEPIFRLLRVMWVCLGTYPLSSAAAQSADTLNLFLQYQILWVELDYVLLISNKC